MNVLSEFMSGLRAGNALRKFDKGKYVEAIPQLERLLRSKENANNVYLHLCMGMSYAGVGQMDKGTRHVLLAYSQHKNRDMAVRYDLVESQRRILLRLMVDALNRVNEPIKAREIEEELLLPNQAL